MEGIIATAVNGVDKDDIKAVRDLACDYVKNPNAIILLTVTCESELHLLSSAEWWLKSFQLLLLADADNQGAYEIVKEYDPDGSRTIGEYLACTCRLILTWTFYRSRNQAGSDRERARRQVVQTAW